MTNLWLIGAVQLNSSLLTISVIVVLLPGAFHMVLQGSTQYDEPSTDYAIVKTSHGVSELVFALWNFDLMSLYRLQSFSFLVGQQKGPLAVNSSCVQSMPFISFSSYFHTKPFTMMSMKMYNKPRATRARVHSGYTEGVARITTGTTSPAIKSCYHRVRRVMESNPRPHLQPSPKVLSQTTWNVPATPLDPGVRLLSNHWWASPCPFCRWPT